MSLKFLYIEKLTKKGGIRKQMKPFIRLLKKRWHIARGKKGYTLIEIAAVVAVTAVLGAVVVPIAVDKVGEGKKSAARQDCQQIGNAISAFHKDIGMWPA